MNRAAERLTRHATGRRGKNEHYKSTGVVSARDLADWDAFVCFAPYAFDATVWAEDGELASLTDEGTSLVMHLGSDQRAKLVASESGVRVVPVKAGKKGTTGVGMLALVGTFAIVVVGLRRTHRRHCC